MAAKPANFVEHMEEHLGRIQAGARLSESIHGVRFADMPEPGASTFATLGLTHHVLKQGGDGPDVRVEFLVACRDEVVDAFNPLSVLAAMSDQAMDLHTAPPRGTVIGPRGRFFPASEMEALYCAAPTYFHEELTSFSGFPEPLVIVWLVPIHPAEARFIRSHGWQKFEEKLDEANPDLLDLGRAAVVDHG